MMNQQAKDGSRFIRHDPCPACPSSDALAVYSNGSAYCFSCGEFFPNYEGTGPDSNEGVKSVPNNTGKLINNVTYKRLRKRRIEKETCQKFKFGYAQHNDETVQVAPYFDESGQLIAQHLKTKDKRFYWLGDAGKVRLWGQHLWPNTGKRIVVTEGEIDAMTIAEEFDLNWPVVSVPNGASSAKKYIKQELEFLEGYDTVVFAFDEDEEGRQAVEECAPLLQAGKAKVASFDPYNDPNEMAQDGKKGKIAKRIFEAKEFRPDGIVGGADLSLEEIMEEEDVQGYELPFPKLDSMLKSLRTGELTTVAAGTGAGKSTFAREIAFHLMDAHDLRIGYVALEESTKKSALGFMAIDLDVPLSDLFMDRSIVDEEELEDSYERIIKPDKFMFYDHFGSLEEQSLLNKIRFLANGLDCDFIVLDHISIVISGIETNDERRAIDKLMTKMRQIVEHSGVGMILVSHLRVPQGNKSPHEEGGRVNLNQLRGSGSIKQLSDNIIAIERNQQDEEDPHLSNIRLLKNRLVGNTGIAGQVRYNTVTGRLQTAEDASASDVNNNNSKKEGDVNFESFEQGDF